MRVIKIGQRGFTLVEVLVAVALLGAIFVTIFELNARCLRFIDASKETVGALQGVQDRVEQLRNLLFTDLTNATTLQTLMTTPSNGSDFAQNVTEVVTLSHYPTPNGTNTQITRGPGASVTANINSTDTNLGNDTPAGTGLVRVNVTYTWTNTLGGQSRSEQTETIISAGTKK
jgi:prepilin-type N-terminal cleavage/methylation domain-containing protein